MELESITEKVVANSLVGMAQYLTDNPDIIGNGFIRSCILQALAQVPESYENAERDHTIAVYEVTLTNHILKHKLTLIYNHLVKIFIVLKNHLTKSWF